MKDDLDNRSITMKFEKWVIRKMQAVRKEGGDSQGKQAQRALIKVNKWKRPKAD